MVGHASPGSDRSGSPNKSMDIDFGRFSVERGKQAEEARAFALSDTLSVRLAATHPIEMQQAFQAAGEFIISACVRLHSLILRGYRPCQRRIYRFCARLPRRDEVQRRHFVGDMLCLED